MASQIRKFIANKVLDAVGKTGSSVDKWEIEKLSWCIRIAPVLKTKNKELCQAQVRVRYADLQLTGLLTKQWADVHPWAHRLTQKIETDDKLVKSEAQQKYIQFFLNENLVNKWTIDELKEKKETYGGTSELYRYRHVGKGKGQAEDSLQDNGLDPQTVIVEYSSPNIAKPFHIGHLRSTVIGNCIANLHKYLGHKVHRINYLGDWGSQFGLLGVGFSKYGSMAKLNSDQAIKHLYQIYVKINEEMVTSASVKEEGLKFFHNIEQGEENATALWKKCKDVSLKEFRQMYERLGITFDEITGESDYHVAARKLIEQLRLNGQLKINDEGIGCIDVGTEHTPYNVSLLKSDGTTLYITRDIAAALQRYKDHEFNQMYYIVENGQGLHFKHLVAVLKKLGHAWAERYYTDFHIKFGRVEGISTRKGQVVFLRDILDEAKAKMLSAMMDKQTTKPGIDLDKVADKLGISALIVQDLKEYREKNYRFNWNKALQFKGDTGVFLQYTHARLCSIEENCGFALNENCKLDSLTETEAKRLVLQLLRWDEAVYHAYVELEPCYILHYLFQLARLCNSAIEVLKVKDTEMEIAQPRLLLFHLVKTNIAAGLEILGITALEKL